MTIKLAREYLPWYSNVDCFAGMTGEYRGTTWRLQQEEAEQERREDAERLMRRRARSNAASSVRVQSAPSRRRPVVNDEEDVFL